MTTYPFGIKNIKIKSRVWSFVKLIQIAIFTLLISACENGGVLFADVPEFNKALPEDFKSRILWEETDQFKYDLAQLSGHVIYKMSDTNKFERGSRITNGTQPSVELIENGEIYQSKIDSNASLEGSYLAFASNIKAEQVVDISIVDTARSLIPYEEVPVSKLIEIANRPKQDNVEQRYYIQGVLLATLTSKYGSKIESNASGVVGGTFGAKGSVFNEESTTSRDYRISLLLIDIDRFSQLSSASGLQGLETQNILRNSQVSSATLPLISFSD